MGTMNMNPKNLIILGVLGVGAYWFLTRKAAARPLQPAGVARVGTQGGGTNPPQKNSVALGLLAGVQQYLGTGGTLPSLPSFSAGSSSIDGLAVNTPTGYLPDASSWAYDESGQGLF